MGDKTVEQRALEFIEKLVNGAGWYISALELDQHGGEALDGEELRAEAVAILNDAGSSRELAAGDLLEHCFCAKCMAEHLENPQSVSCYCGCHNSTRDAQWWDANQAAARDAYTRYQRRQGREPEPPS